MEEVGGGTSTAAVVASFFSLNHHHHLPTQSSSLPLSFWRSFVVLSFPLFLTHFCSFLPQKKPFSPSILSRRKVRKSEGLDLASSFSALFFEVSAAAGRNVEEALAELAKRLRDREDRDLRNAAALRQVKI